MFIGWCMTFYGVYRRDWPGTITAVGGMSLASESLIAEVVHETGQGLS